MSWGGMDESERKTNKNPIQKLGREKQPMGMGWAESESATEGVGREQLMGDASADFLRI